MRCAQCHVHNDTWKKLSFVLPRIVTSIDFFLQKSVFFTVLRILNGGGGGELVVVVWSEAILLSGVQISSERRKTI